MEKQETVTTYNLMGLLQIHGVREFLEAKAQGLAKQELNPQSSKDDYPILRFDDGAQRARIEKLSLIAEKSDIYLQEGTLSRLSSSYYNRLLDQLGRPSAEEREAAIAGLYRQVNKRSM